MKHKTNKTSEANNTWLFFKGMGSISLFPELPEPEPETSPWQGVLDAFSAANGNLTDAICEFKDAQGITH